MNFKKKLFMMSLAASMVVPSNLVLVASVATPVFADNEDDSILSTIHNSFTTQDDDPIQYGTFYFNASREWIEIKAGTYKLNADISLENYSIVIQQGKDVTIDLNGHTITSEADEVFEVIFGTLTLEGGGTVKCISSNLNPAVVRIRGGESSPPKAILNVNENVTLGATNSNALGIYQSGSSKVTLTNCKVNGRTGVEVQSGALEVSGATITSTSTTDLEVEVDIFGFTTYGAAIAVAPHDPNRPEVITVDVDIKGGATLNGKAGLVLIDPWKEFRNDLTDRSVYLQVNKNTQFGSGNIYDIGYTEAMKEFVNGIDLNTSKFHRLKYDTTSEWPTLVADTTSISSSNVTLGSQSLPYTGQARTQEVTVTDGTTPLELNKDYILEYKNNTNVGTRVFDSFELKK